MDNLAKFEQDLTKYKNLIHKQNEAIIRAEATKEHLDKTIQECRDELKNLGIKNVLNPSPEIDQLEAEITASFSKLAELTKDW